MPVAAKQESGGGWIHHEGTRSSWRVRLHGPSGTSKGFRYEPGNNADKERARKLAEDFLQQKVCEQSM